MSFLHQRPLCRISVRGVVQGVGFRPFVYRLAATLGLKGWVCNTSQEVMIEVEGEERAIQSFLNRLRTEAPPRALIETVTHHFAPPEGYETFEIRASRAEKEQYQLISPDIATCPECQRELLDPQDRRYRYPFINCTHCGPRLTIIKDIPYDRPMTTMAAFRMCPECQAEYDDPLHRRFHAQPNCCPRCGPQLELTDAAGRRVESQDPITATATLLKDGKIVALKGIGGFLLACDATNSVAVHLLRMRKKRPFKPLAVMLPGVEEIEKICFLSEAERALLVSPRAPILLLKFRKQDVISSTVAPRLEYLGVMLPYTPLHHLLMREVSLPLVMTSGNLSEEPMVGDNQEALEKLAGIADYFLLHNRDINACCDDSVTMVVTGEVHLIRRARGYAPEPIRLPFKAREILACGAGYKNTFTLTKDHYAFVSQHIGDMDNLETLSHFEKMIDLYKRLFRLKPTIVAHDKHPDYLATRYAEEISENDKTIERVPVQHHHAHIVSCMAENGITSPVLGVAFDGTGYGDDGTIWGGEFLLTDYHRFTRLAHFEYVPLPGGDAAVKKPYRMAVSYLYALFGDEVFHRNLEFLEGLDAGEMGLLKTQIEKRINSPMTSSAGRLFDAVSALLAIRKEVDYEGQAAVELEMEGTDAGWEGETYPFRMDTLESGMVIRLKDLFAGIITDLERSMPKSSISLKFHHTVAQVISNVCQALSRSHSLKQIALSGGVFQNRLLFRLTRTYLKEAGLEVITHRHVPCNDGCISLGQAVIASFLVSRGVDTHGR